jgi:hypothetical protein
MLCLLSLLGRPIRVVAVAAVLTVGMLPFIELGHFLHRPFAPTRFEVDEGPLRAVLPGSVVIADAAAGPSGFLLTYLRPGVRRHVIHSGFYGTPILARLQREQLAVTPRIYVIEGSTYRSVSTTQRLRQKLGLQLSAERCVRVKNITQPRWLCPATWVQPVVADTNP